MPISNKYVVVKKVQEPPADGFQAVEPTDSFVYKGEVVELPGDAVYVSNHCLEVGDKVHFMKYSPDTVEIDRKGEKVKFVRIDDLLEVII